MKKITAILLVTLLAGILVFAGCSEKEMDDLNGHSSANVTDVDNRFDTQEISKHNSKSDCWILVSGIVYDITEHLDEYNDEVLLKMCGDDAITVVNDKDSSLNKQELRKYLIGKAIK